MDLYDSINMRESAGRGNRYSGGGPGVMDTRGLSRGAGHPFRVLLGGACLEMKHRTHSPSVQCPELQKRAGSTHTRLDFEALQRKVVQLAARCEANAPPHSIEAIGRRMTCSSDGGSET